MPKVLIITKFFPPFPNMASSRLGGLAKYLPKFGWEPIILMPDLKLKTDPRYRVITTEYPGDTAGSAIKSLGLNPSKRPVEQIPLPSYICESNNYFIVRFIDIIGGILIYPDAEKKWFPFALKEAERLLRTEPIDAIISSSAPVTAHMVASALNKQFQIPWVADLRDLWSQTHLHSYGLIRKWRERRLEVQTLKNAAALTTVSQPLADELANLHLNKRINTILNGFDPDDVTPAKLTTQFTITYTGLIYPRKQNPVALLRALRELIDSRQIDPRQVCVRFIGRPQYWLRQEIKKKNLQNIVQEIERIPREESLARQRESQVLLFLNWNDPRQTGVYTGKIFEYLSARRPILAFGPRDVTSKLIEDTRTGFQTTNLSELKDCLLKLYTEFLSAGFVSYQGRDETISQYTQIEMARKFAELLTQTSHVPAQEGKHL